MLDLRINKSDKMEALTMATEKNGMTDSQADALAAVVVVLTIVAAAIYWVATAS